MLKYPMSLNNIFSNLQIEKNGDYIMVLRQMKASVTSHKITKDLFSGARQSNTGYLT